MRKSWLLLAIPLAVMAGIPLPASAAGAVAIGSIPGNQFAWAARDRADVPPGASPAEIEAAAIAECKRAAATAKATGETCKVVLRYDSQCAALAATQHHIGWAKAEQIDDAKRQAMATCVDDARASGESCRVIGAFCDK